MATLHKARFTNGVLKPLDDGGLREGDEVLYMKATDESAPALERKDPVRAASALDRTAGSWADIVDCDKLIRDIYESRAIQTRPTPEL